jgi:cytochrome b561
MVTDPDAIPQDEVILRYNNGAVLLHWVTAALVLTQVYVGFSFADMPRGPARMQWFAWHKTIGVTILVLALIRLAWRLAHRPPPFPPELPSWERVAAVWSHRLFYVLLIALPLTGLIALSGGARGPTSALIGGIPLPLIPGLSKATGEAAGSVHEALVYTTIALLVIHVCAALKHQFADQTRTSGRMPPFRTRDASPTRVRNRRQPEAAAERLARLRSCGSRCRLRRRIDLGVTSTSSSSWM